MNIGLTFDLKVTYLKQGFSHDEVAELDSEETIAGIEHALASLGYRTERIGNIVELTHALVAGKRWDIVFNIAEGLYGIGREAQVPALLDAFKIPYVFSNPAVLGVTLHKAMAKHIVRGHGIPTADFCVVNNREEIDQVQLDFPVFIKPVAEGTGKGIGLKSLVTNREDLQTNIMELLEKYQQAVLVEVFLPGREFTVGVTGTGKDALPCGIMEVSVNAADNEKIYSRYNKEHYEGKVDYFLPEKEISGPCLKLAMAAWNALECYDGGRVDIKMDKNGVPNFIEVNPLAGLNPIHSDLPILCRMNGITYTMLMEKIMRSALQRIADKF